MKTEPAGGGKAQRSVMIFGFLFMLLAGVCAYFLIRTRAAAKAPVAIKQKNRQDFDQRLEKEKELIRQDLEQKYAADIVSYNAMAKRLELEKQRVRELEQKAPGAGTK